MSDKSNVSVPRIARLEKESILELSGEDAAKFLQGQSTADFANAQQGDVIPGAFCNVKGRVLGDFVAWVENSGLIFLRCEQAVAAALSLHLKPYLNFSRSTLTLLPAQVFGVLYDAESPDQLLHTAGHNTRTTLLVQRFPGASEYWVLDGTSELTASVSADEWYARMIAMDDARISEATIAQYLPQDLNFDLRGYINFQKGCYTGQEIIARLHYRGTPKRRLYQGLCAASQLCPPGTQLLATDGAQKLGSVVNSAIFEDQQCLLVEATADAFERGIRAEGLDLPVMPWGQS